MKRSRPLASRLALAFAASALTAASILACTAGDLSLGGPGKDAGIDTGSTAPPHNDDAGPTAPLHNDDAGTCPAVAPKGACTEEGLQCSYDINHGCAGCTCSGGGWTCDEVCAIPTPDAGDGGQICNNGPSPLAALTCTPHAPGCDAGAECDAGSGPPATWDEAISSCGTTGETLNGSCGGYLAMSAPRGADGEYVYLYDAATKAYAATLEGANDASWSCNGPPSVTIDIAQCFHADAYGFCAYGQSWTRCATTPVTCPATEPTLGQPCSGVGVCTYPSATICELHCDGATWNAETPGCGLPPLDAGQADAN